MNPIEHGEIFVTDDGTECDQDVGNYERFLDQDLESTNYITTGRVYQAVIQKERNLEYNGKCVEVVPHIPEEVIRRINRAQRKTKADFVLVIQKERNLEYNGKCVEVVPHIPEEVIRRINRAQRKTKADFVLIEIGGTVGEYQNLLFLEAARILKLKHPQDVVFILVSYLPIPKMIGEMKTKPTQQI